ncbi:MAG: 6,7-dimethyl-8-ribityllumazine synthase [Tenacibaculum sp.]
MATINLSAYNKTKIPSAKAFRFGIVVSQWNDDITQNLYQGAVETLVNCGAYKKNIITWSVPGSFELVYASKKMVKTQLLDAVIVIGCLIKGETEHFNYVCQGIIKGIADLNILYDTPVIFCVLTDSNKEQSVNRSGGKLGNKGVECALAAVKMATLQDDVNELNERWLN